jgi:hypothetical protein
MSSSLESRHRGGGPRPGSRVRAGSCAVPAWRAVAAEGAYRGGAGDAQGCRSGAGMRKATVLGQVDGTR